MRNLKCPLCNAEIKDEIVEGMNEIKCSNCGAAVYTVKEIIDKKLVISIPNE